MTLTESKSTTEESEWSDEAPSKAEESDEAILESSAFGFGDAMKNVLKQNIPENVDPILAKRKTARMREMEENKSIHKKHKWTERVRKEKQLKNMVIPDHTSILKEREHRIMATKGVVALFNAIEKYQHGKKSSEENSKSDLKVKQLPKTTFLDLLKKPKQKTQGSIDKNTVNSPWLQDSFMMKGEQNSDDDSPSVTKPKRKRKEKVRSNNSQANILKEMENEDEECMIAQE